MKYFLLCTFLFATVSLSAQPSLFDSLYQRTDSVHLSLDTDWRQLTRQRKSKAWQPVTVTVHGLGGPIVLPGRVRSRGNFRLNVCTNPSLKIKLKKAPLLAAGFSDLNDLKLVLQCNNGETGLQYLRREHLAYQLHEVVSEHSHRTLPAVYYPTDKKVTQLVGFLIESEEQLARRYDRGKVVKARRMSTSGLDRPAYVNMCLFNYLILNTDWSVFNLHNVECVIPGVDKAIIPIPYDFDYSGFVNTSYATPQAQLEIESVQIPYWLGKQVTPAELQAGAEHYLRHETALLKIVDDHPDLERRDQKRIRKRLEAFFELMADEKKLFRLLQ